MAKPFSQLRNKMSPEARAKSEELTKQYLAEMYLFELRQARGLSQQMLADILNVQQPAIAKMERRADMYISTLRSHIEAMGGTLEITAKFEDREIKIKNFSEIDKPVETEA